jgi:hypothetical protein
MIFYVLANNIKELSMHAATLLHNLFKNACHQIDKRVQRTLFEAADTLTRCKELSIFGLGRMLPRPSKVKHNIKCIDRLFGNTTLHARGKAVYEGMTGFLLKNNKRPVIIVDWSGLTPCGAYHFLRASVTVGGRALTLYDQAYALRDYSKASTHRQFLKTLKNILPEGCRPIIITDAGFRNTWFKSVLGLGWDFIGRVRNKTQYQGENSYLWKPIKALYEKATLKACYVGQVILARSKPLPCYFHLMKQRKKHRVKRNLVGKKVQCSVSKKHARREKEPWLLASSLSPEEASAVDIMLLYKKRMQIEESFRDLKNTRNGFSLRNCRSYQLKRLNVALLIAALAMLILWLVGTAAKQCHLHYSFQANTEKRRNVLSNFMIGWQVLMRDTIQFSKKELMTALRHISSSASGRVIC